MPVRINLKELFAADVQTIFTDKINFNFNKMLELGIGEIGERGITGPGGSAGPGGIPGPEGQRGNKWFIGTGDPNGQSFTGLIDGDFYLDTSTSSIWQYSDTSPGGWTLVADISAIVINFLESLGSPFVRGVGDASPLDDRFIVFQHRSNTDFERTADSTLGNNSDNDMLLLNNWNEHLNGGGLGLSNFPANTDELFNSLNFISIDHTINTQGRYHMEMGSLYQSTSAASNVISSLTHNLKIKYLMDTAAGPSYPNSNIDGVIISSFSLTNPPSEPFTTIDKNAIFEFWTPKFNDDGAGTIQENIKFAMGAQEGLADFFPTLIPMDGFVIQHFGISALEIGINGVPSDSLSNLPVVFDDVPMAIIDGTDDTSLFINKEIIQTGGDIQNVPTTPVEFLSKDVLNQFPMISTLINQQRIFSNGENIFMTQGDFTGQYAESNQFGRLTIYETSSPTNPTKIHEITTDSITAGTYPMTPQYDLHGHMINGVGGGDYGPYAPDEIPLSGVMDVTFAGKYGYLCRSLRQGVVGTTLFQHTFEVFEMDSNGNNLHTIASLEHSSMEFAKRVKTSGQYAFVMSAQRNTIGLATVNAITSISLCESIVDPIGQPFFRINPPTTNLPTMDYISDETGGTLSDWLDFDIYNDKAYILSKDRIGVNDELTLVTLSVENPANMYSMSSGTPIIAEWTGHSQPPGAVKVDSQHAYVVCGDAPDISGGNFSIISLSEQNRLGPPPVLLSSLQIEPSLIDVEVSGDYAYVLARFPSGNATIIIIDISDKTTPFVVAMDSSGLTECINPSSMTLRGKHIYVAAAGTNPASLDTGMYIFNIDGIKSSSANIGNIASNEIKVSGKISAGQSIDVGTSVTVGQNLNVQGNICVGGTINVDQYSFGMVPIGTMMPWVGDVLSDPLPAGWLACDGGPVSQLTYPELYDLLPAGRFGFNDGDLPLMRNKTIVDPGLTVGVQGTQDGSATYTIVASDLPSHVHGIGAGTFDLAGSFSTGNQSANHSHETKPDNDNYNDGFTGVAGNKIFARTSSSIFPAASGGGVSASHSHSVDFSAMLTPPTVTLSGNTGAQVPATTNNPIDLHQPMIAINYIIYAGEPA